jgi:2-polyprenyl-3-methyl-5-hydroxy-6-metoxy-1,4-benzoquinol methylase
MLGAKIFALNGCASFLNHNIAIPDYQVILDAQKCTTSLISDAKRHLFASQVDPECFEIVPNAQLWQATHGDVALEFPEYENDYCMVGGAISVGNAALVLAYVMGYREIHCYGFDSRHKDGEGHAFKQSINNGDPTTIVRFMGKEYISSITMKLQAKYFMERAYALKQEGCKIEVHGDGLLPAMYNCPTLSEQEKYEMMWWYRDYGDVSPGQRNAEFFVKQFKPQGTVIDFGCGSGKGGAKIAELSGCKVIFADFADNSLDKEFAHHKFVHFDMRIGRSDLHGDIGYCCDVMEHIPPESVDSAINNVMRCVPKAYFQISTVEDNWGVLIGQKLHLSVHPASWWEEKIKSLDYTVEWSAVSEMECYFFITLTT